MSCCASALLTWLQTLTSGAPSTWPGAGVLLALVLVAVGSAVLAVLVAQQARALVGRHYQALAEGLRRDQEYKMMQNTYEAVVRHEVRFRAVADIVRGWAPDTAAEQLARLSPDDLRTLHEGLVALEYVGVAFNLGLLHRQLLLRLIGIFYYRTVERLRPYILRVRREENIDRLYTDCQLAAEALRKLDEETRGRDTRSEPPAR